MGKKINREFFASVRHLNLKTVHDLSFLATAANKQKLILKSSIAGNEIFKTNFSKIYNLGINLLKKNPYCFLKQKQISNSEKYLLMEPLKEKMEFHLEKKHRTRSTGQVII